MTEDYILIITDENNKPIAEKVFYTFPEQEDMYDAIKDAGGVYGRVAKRWGVVPFA